MSEEKLNEIRERIRKIQSIGMTEPATTRAMKRETGKYGDYQHFQSECMKKVEPDNPNSPSRIEVITGQVGAHSTKRMALCSRLWKKYRGLPDPIDGLMKELEVAEKIERGEEP